MPWSFYKEVGNKSRDEKNQQGRRTEYKIKKGTRFTCHLCRRKRVLRSFQEFIRIRVREKEN
jgi:hypothetical protein